jgi:hypothetical protein
VLKDFSELDEDLLREAVREGEILVAAQFQSALNADQRAMAWVSIVAALASAAFGATAWLAYSRAPVPYLAVMFLFASALALAGFVGSLAVRPGKFQLPGNEPGNWLHWQNEPELHQALIEQARNLDLQASQNRLRLESAGRKLQLSIDVFFWAIAALFLSALVLYTLSDGFGVIPPAVPPPAA